MKKIHTNNNEFTVNKNNSSQSRWMISFLHFIFKGLGPFVTFHVSLIKSDRNRYLKQSPCFDCANVKSLMHPTGSSGNIFW